MARYLLTLVCVLGLAPLVGACAEGIEDDAIAATVAQAPLEALQRPPREDRRHWLLLGAEGWCGSHLTRFGGEAEDPGVAVVRVARFDSSESAARAFAQIDPAYFYRIFRAKMVRPPQYIFYPTPLPGDRSFVIAYDARLPFELPPGQSIEGQLITVQSGPFIAVIENIGVPSEQIIPAVGQIVQAAEQRAGSGC
jgi:hypothetical protein